MARPRRVPGSGIILLFTLCGLHSPPVIGPHVRSQWPTSVALDLVVGTFLLTTPLVTRRRR
ncbi:hypothetical protein BO70DRAFT_357857 [Aspergillus heteromorphus CBS 117.55]|uniref:Uncharacterized protein n=1 Tax=Aspergillus heteromorphus CBS 117.55 TaxID=1448321 RepID=A0A317X813_9EURO|nr:uncharacterized protein BO70DRAFT_357857 [Aspergillus heteromorphus CBS 117.55]PWY92720.1 hypothetical protein BO70DRAFT_357857 [Aspergillus heteromorphus CBS 117.55]